jgi:spore coat protein U-like protein
MGRWLPALLVIAGTLALPAPAAAQCSITATGMAFGTYDVFSASPLDATATVRVQCNAVFRNIEVRLSTGSSSTFSPRTMLQGATNVLNYNIYRAADHSSIWGDGTGGTSYYTGTIWFWGSVTLTGYGRIPAGQDVRSGAYSDTVQAIVNF